MINQYMGVAPSTFQVVYIYMQDYDWCCMQCTFMFAVHNSRFRSYFRASNLNKSWGGFMFIDAYCLSIEFCSDLLIEYFESVKTTKLFFKCFCSDLLYTWVLFPPEDPCFNLRPTFTININHACREIHHPKIDPSWVSIQLGCVGCFGVYRGFYYPVIWWFIYQP